MIRYDRSSVPGMHKQILQDHLDEPIERIGEFKADENYDSGQTHANDDAATNGGRVVNNLADFGK